MQPNKRTFSAVDAPFKRPFSAVGEPSRRTFTRSQPRFLLRLPQASSAAADEAWGPGSIRKFSSSSVRQVSHPGQNSAHIAKALNHARHRIVAMNLVFQIHEARILDVDQRLENIADRQDPFADSHLAFAAHVDWPSPCVDVF